MSASAAFPARRGLHGFPCVRCVQRNAAVWEDRKCCAQAMARYGSSHRGGCRPRRGSERRPRCAPGPRHTGGRRRAAQIATPGHCLVGRRSSSVVYWPPGCRLPAPSLWLPHRRCTGALSVLSLLCDAAVCSSRLGYGGSSRWRLTAAALPVGGQALECLRTDPREGLKREVNYAPVGTDAVGATPRGGPSAATAASGEARPPLRLRLACPTAHATAQCRQSHLSDW